MIFPTIIRKTPQWRTYEIPWMLTISWILCIIIALFWTIGIISTILSNWESLLNLLRIFNPLIFLFVWIIILVKIFRIRKVRKFKTTWWWTIKKLQISSIERHITHRRWWSNWYYLQANEWFTSYCSDLIKDWKIESVLINPNFDKIYNKYWFEYDENETHKKDVLNEIDKRKIEEEYKAKNWWLLKKLTIKWLFSKDDRKIVETWYQTPYLIVNWHKASVWDTVDVYIDPNDGKNYWMDIDFLFEE